jgi:hypothetical protein
MTNSHLSLGRVVIAQLIALILIVIGVFFSFNFALYPLFISPFFEPFWLAGLLRNLITQAQLVLPLILAEIIGIGALWMQVRSVWKWQRLARLQRWLAAGLVVDEALFVALPFVWASRLPFTGVATLVEILTIGLLVAVILGCVALAIIGKRWGWLTLLLAPLLLAVVDFALTSAQMDMLSLPFYTGVEVAFFTSLAFALFGSPSVALRTTANQTAIT